MTDPTTTQPPAAQAEPWTSSREDMDSYTTNPATGETEHVVYVYPPGDNPRIAIFGPKAREYAQQIAACMTAVTADASENIALTATRAVFGQIANNLTAQRDELLSVCNEMLEAHYRYSRDYDEDPPVAHREMMHRAEVAISRAQGGAQ